MRLFLSILIIIIFNINIASANTLVGGKAVGFEFNEPAAPPTATPTVLAPTDTYTPGNTPTPTRTFTPTRTLTPTPAPPTATPVCTMPAATAIATWYHLWGTNAITTHTPLGWTQTPGGPTATNTAVGTATRTWTPHGVLDSHVAAGCPPHPGIFYKNHVNWEKTPASNGCTTYRKGSRIAKTPSATTEVGCTCYDEGWRRCRNPDTRDLGEDCYQNNSSQSVPTAVNACADAFAAAYALVTPGVSYTVSNSYCAVIRDGRWQRGTCLTPLHATYTATDTPIPTPTPTNTPTFTPIGLIPAVDVRVEFDGLNPADAIIQLNMDEDEL